MAINKKTKPGRLHNWLKAIPGTRVDYILLLLASLDILILMFAASYTGYLPAYTADYILIFDYFVVTLWGLHTLYRIKKSKDSIAYIKNHWYEIVGLVPLPQLRVFFLLRAVKLAIIYYKIGRSEKNVLRLKSADFSFRFRDVFIDAIADAVFVQSLRRVEEVMIRLDYNKLAQDVLAKHETQLRAAIIENIESNSIIGDIAKIPLMSPFSRGIGNSVADGAIELIQKQVLGEIFRDITASILNDMNKSLKELDLVRITETDDYKLYKHKDNDQEAVDS